MIGSGRVVYGTAERLRDGSRVTCQWHVTRESAGFLSHVTSGYTKTWWVRYKTPSLCRSAGTELWRAAIGCLCRVGIRPCSGWIWRGSELEGPGINVTMVTRANCSLFSENKVRKEDWSSLRRFSKEALWSCYGAGKQTMMFCWTKSWNCWPV